MTVLDWAIVAFVILLIPVGFARGFIAGALALGGFALGAFAGARLAPMLLAGGSESPYGAMFALVGAVLLGAILAGILEAAGTSVQSRMRGALGIFDGVLGAGLTAVLALGLAWLAGAAVLTLPGTTAVRGDVRRSSILQSLNDVLPSSGPILNALARLDPLPEIDGPTPDLPAPTQKIARDPDITGARDSVARIQGEACGGGVVGSGWVAGDDLVVTNAHVVAGVDDPSVEIGGDGPRLDASTVAFDPRNDVAVLRVDGLDAPALSLEEDVDVGSQAAILGFPGNGPFDIRAARVGKTVTTRTQDVYGRGPLRRRITLVRGKVRPGNSGGPVLNASGDVVTTIFAQSVGSEVNAGYGVPNEIVEETLAGAGGPVSTGPCVG
ncbi:MAG TPA: MarP family serine protease [Solirubrobacteraceae bacterium]|nr:MarP family serine protease [Solirubrobacteraceae bacterium]